MDEKIATFWNKVEKTDTCWNWNGYINKDGYGQFLFAGKLMRAHRISYFLHHGKWPKNFACHKCNNKRCVNPKHLYDGTNTDNMRDLKNYYKKQREIYNMTTKTNY